MKALILITSIFGLFLVGAIAEGLHLWVIWHQWPAMIMIYGPLAAYLVGSQGFKGTLGLFRRLFDHSATEADVSFIRQLSVLSLLLGSMGMIIGIIILMARLTGGMNMIGDAIATALLSPLFAVMPCVLMLPFTKVTPNSKSLIHVAAAFSGFTVVSGLGISALTVWGLQ